MLQMFFHVNKYTFFSILFVALLISCKTIQPVAPLELSSSEKFRGDVSEVIIPINISIPGMQASINKKLHGLLYEDNDLDDNGGDNLMLKVWKKSDITLELNGDEVYYKLPLDVWVKGGFKISTFGANISNYKEGKCALTLEFKSKISIDSLWNVQIKTISNGFEWIEKPVIKIGNFYFPVTLIANKILNSQLPELAAAIDEHAKESLHIKKYVEETWIKIQKPIKLSTNPEFWLAIQPIGISILPFQGKTESINSSIGIHAYVSSQLYKMPEQVITPLPHLKVIPAMNNKISISLVADISYEAVSKLAGDKLIKQIFHFNNGKQQVTITGVKIYPSQHKLVSKIDLMGSVIGSVYLEGIPYFDTTSLSLKMKELDYHINTKNALIKSANWLFHGTFVKKIEPLLTYSLADQLLASKTLLQEGLREKNITKYIVLKGNIEKLLPQQIILSTENIKTIVNATGSVEVKVNGFE